MGLQEELAEKRRRVVEYLQEHQLDAVVLTRQDNFAWFTAGKDNHVEWASDVGAASLFITADDCTLVTTNIETPRLAIEEIAEHGYQIKSVPWYQGMESAILELAEGKRVGADTAIPGTIDIRDSFSRLRYSLTSEEIERLKVLGRKAGEAVAETCFAIKPGQTEHEIAAQLMERLTSQGIVPVVVLVGTDERISQFRHPIPTNKRLEKSAMLVLCARQAGLIVAVTRLVHFGVLPPELRKKHDAVVRIDATLISQTRVGACVGDILAKGISVYELEGYPSEWRLHHQGGPCGYATREYLAVPGCREIVQPNQPFAWNPSITGTKSEDTILATDSGVEIITAADDWPLVDVEVDGRLYSRPEILIR